MDPRVTPGPAGWFGEVGGGAGASSQGPGMWQEAGKGITPAGKGRERERDAAGKHRVGTLPSAGEYLLFSSF